MINANERLKRSRSVRAITPAVKSSPHEPPDQWFMEAPLGPWTMEGCLGEPFWVCSYVTAVPRYVNGLLPKKKDEDFADPL